MNLKNVIVSLIVPLIWSCSEISVDEQKIDDYSEVKLVEEVDAETLDESGFKSFLSLFKKVELPYELKYGNFSDFNQADPGIDSFVFKVSREDNLPFETIDPNNIKLWILGNGNHSNELDKWLEEHLDDPDNYWHSITSGVYYENRSLDKYYVLINIYDQTSASNGGCYTEWLLEYDGEGIMNSCHKLGQEGYYSSRHIDFESGDGKFYLSCESLNIKFINRYYMTVSKLEWREMDGQLEDEDFVGIDSYYMKGETVIYDVKESTYSIKF